MRGLMWTLTIVVLIGAAYILGRVTPPSELQQAHTQAAITNIERQTAIDAAVTPFEVVTASLLSLVPVAVAVIIIVWAAGLLWIDLTNAKG
jgi:hypothetical protein